MSGSDQASNRMSPANYRYGTDDPVCTEFQLWLALQKELILFEGES